MAITDQDIQALRRAYRTAAGLDYIPAVIGDASGTVSDPLLHPGKVLVREFTPDGMFVGVWVNPPVIPMRLTWGRGVSLKTNSAGDLYIYGIDSAASLAAGVDPISIIAQETSRQNTQTGIQTLAVFPSQVPDLSVTVRAWNPIVGTTAYQFPGATVDLTSFVPSAGNMRYATIFVKSDYATTEVFGSTAVPVTDPPLGLVDIQECITAASTLSTPVFAVKLIGGQTQIKQSDLSNDGAPLQQMVNTASSISGGSGSVIYAQMLSFMGF